MRHLRSTVLLTAAAVAVTACGESGPPVPVPTSISLSNAAVTLAALGATQQLSATVKDQSGQAMTGQPVTWSAANTGVATVSAGGLVTAVANGQTQVTAASGTLDASATVTVAQAIAQLGKTAGDAQTATVGTQLGAALEVEARDSQGHPVPGTFVGGTITFAVTQGNGSVSQSSVPLGANGRAATQFTVGTAAGTSHRVTATLTGGSASAQFSATATAGPADTLAYVSGTGQTAPKGAALLQSLVVRAADQFGNPVPSYQVSFVPTAGGGSFNPASVMTGGNGQAASAWTLGAAATAQTAEAQGSTAITGSPVGFTATGIDFAISAIAPDTIVEGAAATITGMGFDATPANNTVTIGGAAAAVTAAAATSLTVTVPTFSCQPGRTVSVQVTVGGVGSNTIAHPLNPAAFVALAVGQQQIILSPASFCLQFPASAASEAYLIGVQSLSETPSELTAARLIAGTGFPSPAPARMLLEPALQAGARTTPLSPRSARWLAHRRAEAVVLDENERIIAGMPAGAALPRTPAGTAGFVGPNVAIGDTLLDLRVTSGGGTCSAFDAITTVVRAKGQRSIWLEDVANPVNGYTAADFDSLSKYMDNVIFDTDTSYFGDPGDQDANGRIVIIVTRRVNLRSSSLLGFVTSCDFYARTISPPSNEGEFFYAKAPDPTGALGSVYPRSEAVLDAPFLIGHEFSHVIQFARRLPLAGAVFTSWLLEGQATLAEEVVGHARTGRVPGQNYDFGVAFNSPPTTDIYWYVNAFADLAVYFGFLTPTTKVAQAPHECTWIGRQTEGNTGPCLSGREVYGTPWSLYRWASDQFGPGFTGGERGLQKAIILNPAGGYANLAGTLGVSIDTLLAQWAAMLYVDDRVPGAAQRLTLPSWNMLDIFDHIVASGNLQPADIAFAAFDQARNVRAGSTAYFRISGSSRPATAVRARSSTDTALPGLMNVWIVRLQ